MIIWRWLLVLVVLAALASFGWHWIVADPGTVLVQIRGWEVHTTLLVAVVLVVLAVIALYLLGKWLRWTWRAPGKHRRNVGRKRLQSGLVLLAEGHYPAAQRVLTKAAKHKPQARAALLAAADAAMRRGDTEAATELLKRAQEHAPLAASAEHARMLRLTHHADAAVSLLSAPAKKGKLSPAGWLELTRSALATGQADRAMAALTPLRKTGVLSADSQNDLELQVLAAAMAASKDETALKRQWDSLNRAQRKRPAIVGAFARRMAKFGQGKIAMRELEGALKHRWSADLVTAWGDLGDVAVEQRLKRAESWLPGHPGDAALLWTLGRLCTQLKVWGKAREYLQQSIEADPQPRAWEALGDVYAAQDAMTLAARCYRNALCLERGAEVTLLPGMQAPVEQLGHDGQAAEDAAGTDKADDRKKSAADNAGPKQVEAVVIEGKAT